MPKKEKITIQRDETLEMIDAELDGAMTLLDRANQKVNDILASIPAPDLGVVASCQLPVAEPAREDNPGSEKEK